MLIISESDYARLQAVVSAAQAALDAAVVLRGIGNDMTRNHIAMQALQAAITTAASVKVQAAEDANSKRIKRPTK